MNKPTAAPARFPYNHRNMAEVMADEQRERDASKLRRVYGRPRGRAA